MDSICQVLRFILFIASFLTIMSVFHAASGLSNEEICQKCTDKINATTDYVRTQLAKRDPLHLNTPEPCSQCTIRGISTLSYVGQVCPQKVVVNGSDCYDHKIRLRFSPVEINCNCSVPTTVRGLLNLVLQLAKNPLKIIQCDEPNQIPIDPMTFANETTDVAKVNPLNILSIAECKSLYNQLNLPRIQNSNEVTGGILLTYSTVELDYTFRACVGSPNVTITDIFIPNTDPKDVTFKCLTDKNADFFQNFCDCLVQTDYLHKIATSFIKGIFPCYGNVKVKDETYLVNSLTCLEFVNP